MRRWWPALAVLAACCLAASSAHAEPISLALAAGFVAVGVGVETAAILAQVTLMAVGIGISMGAQALFSPPQPKPSDGQVVVRQATAPRFRSYGRVKVGGVLMFMNSQAGILHRVIAMGSGELDGVEEHWIDDNLVALDGGGNVTTSPYAGKVRIENILGDTSGSYRYLLLESSFPTLWTPAHLGLGVPSAYILMHQVSAEQMSDVYPRGGDTLYRQVQRGARVPDVTDTAFAGSSWSDNAARIIADYLTHPDGLRLPLQFLQNAFPYWHAAIAASGEAVPSPVGDEPRWRIWNTYRFDERPAEVLQRLCQACDAMLFSTPGQGLAIKVGKWEAPTVTIDDDAIIAFSEVRRGGDLLTSANTIRARYTEPAQDYQETDAVPMIDAADVAARGEMAVDFDYFAAPSHNQCRRLMKVQAYRLNPAWSGTVTCNLRAITVLGERFAVLTCTELGIVGETVEISDVKFIVEGAILTGVQFQFASMSADAWAWDGDALRALGATPYTAPEPIVPERDLPLPTGLAVTLSGARAVVTWDAPPNDFLQVDVRWKPTSAAEWLLAPVAPGSTATVVEGLASGVEYTFQIRHRSTPTGRVTDWDAVATTATPDYDDDGSYYRRIEA